MFELFTPFFSFAFSVIASIVGNVLTPFAKKLFSWPYDHDDDDPDQPLDEPPLYDPDLSEEKKEKIREYNRQRIIKTLSIAALYFLPFLVIYYGMWAVVNFKMTTEGYLYFEQTRLVGLLGDASLSSTATNILVFLLALLLYIPCVRTAQNTAYYIAKLIDQVHKVTKSLFFGITLLVLIVITLFIDGHIVYLLYPKLNYAISIALPFLIVLGAGAAMLSNNSDNKKTS